MKLSDVNIILQQYKIATYFGFPLIYEVTSSKLKRIFSKCYSVAIFFAYFVFTLICLIERAKTYTVFFAPMQILIDVLQLFSEMFFISVCLLWPTKRFQHWKTFWSHLKVLDKHLTKLNFEETQNSFLCGTIISVCFAIIFCAQFWEIQFWYHMGRFKIIYSYMNFRMVMYYQLFVTILISQITRMLKVRFDFLNNYLHKVGTRKHILWDVSQTEACFTIHRLQGVSKLYAMIYEIVHIFNKILGWHIFFIISSTILEILSAVNFGIAVFSFNSHMSMDIIIINVVYSMIYLVSTF